MLYGIAAGTKNNNMNTSVREWLEIECKKGWMVKRLSEIVDNPDVDFKVGDRVVFTNDYGVSFPNQKIIAIGKDEDMWKYGHCIYLNKESYWHPVKPESLELQQS